MFFDTSVQLPTREFMGQSIGGGRVNNLGLIADRQNGMIAGAAAAVLGLLRALFGRKR
jgi:hypothetical protein